MLLILSSKMLTLLNNASRIRPQCCMLHLLKSGREGEGLGLLFLNFLDLPLDIPWYTTRGRCITRMYFKLVQQDLLTCLSCLFLHFRRVCESVFPGIPDKPQILSQICWVFRGRSRQDLHPLSRGTFDANVLAMFSL